MLNKMLPVQEPSSALLIISSSEKMMLPKLPDTRALYRSHSWRALFRSSFAPPGAFSCTTTGRTASPLGKSLKTVLVAIKENMHSKAPVFLGCLWPLTVFSSLTRARKGRKELALNNFVSDYLQPQLWSLRICILTSTQLILIKFHLPSAVLDLRGRLKYSFTFTSSIAFV